MKTASPFRVGGATGHVVTFDIDGVEYKIGLLDERPDVDHDPTLLLFRGNEEEAVVTVHISPDAKCVDRDHITLEEHVHLKPNKEVK